MHHKRRRARHQRGTLFSTWHKRGGQAKTYRVKGLKAPRRAKDIPAE